MKSFSPKNVISKYLYPTILISVIILAFYILCPYLNTQRLWPDEALYGWYARQILANPSLIFSKEIIEFHPPLFSVLLATGHVLFPEELADHLIPLLVNISGIFLIYLLGTKIKDPFTGLCAAINLAFNFLYLSGSTHILIDGTLAVFVMLFIHVLLNTPAFPARSSPGEQIAIGTMAALAILLKWSGVLVIPLFLFYLSLCPINLSLPERFKRSLLAFAVPLMTIFFLLLNNFHQLGHFLPDISALEGKYLIKPAWYYLFNLHNVLILPYLIPLFLFGIFIILKERAPGHVLLITWFLVFLVGISLAPEKDLRYSVLLLPSALLISCVGLSTLLERCAKTKKQRSLIRVLAIIALLGTYGILFPRAQKFLDKSAMTFTGFKEAGQRIKEETSASTLIMASSPRIIRYYSNINFKEFGGQIVALPADRLIFEEAVNSAKGPLIVTIDHWEKTSQPEWLYPISQNTRQYMENLGFRLIYIGEKEIYGSTGEKEIAPVIWVFKK